MELKKVFICSPYAPRGETQEARDKDRERNIDTAVAACRHAVRRGCIPYAPHLYFTQFLDDDDRSEREYGQNMGITWLEQCDELWVIGYHTSSGMQREIRRAEELGIPIRHFVPRWPLGDSILDDIFRSETVFKETF